MFTCFPVIKLNAENNRYTPQMVIRFDLAIIDSDMKYLIEQKVQHLTKNVHVIVASHVSAQIIVGWSFVTN